MKNDDVLNRLRIVEGHLKGNAHVATSRPAGSAPPPSRPPLRRARQQPESRSIAASRDAGSRAGSLDRLDSARPAAPSAGSADRAWATPP